MVPIHELNRRLFLWQMGKGVLGVAVLGAAVAACGDDDDDEGAAPSDTTSTTPPLSIPSGESSPLIWKRASLGFVSAWVLVRGKEAAVVDTGTDAGEEKVAEALTAAGRGWGGVGPPGEQYTEDMPTAHASVKKLAGLDFETILFGHGEPIETGGRQAMETLAATLG